MFFVAVLLQRVSPIGVAFFRSVMAVVIGLIMLLVGVFFLFPAIRQFFTSKNTLITIKSANSLQTTGIYSVSRNPMYVGLLFLYLGISFLVGNWWNLMLLPALILVVQTYVIKREERYLSRTFGQPYLDYKERVRRWL